MSTQQHAQTTPQLAGRSATLAVLVVLFASFMDLLDVTIVTVAAPDIARELGASAAQLQWMLAAYIVALGSGLITGGRLGDGHGRRRVFLISLSAFALASAACALAPTAEALIGLRAVQGLAGGFMVPQVFGIIRASLQPAAMAKALGAYGAVQGLASVAGPLLGGALVEGDLFGLGWRTIFWINVPVAVVALLLGLRVLPESGSGGSLRRLDLTGSLLSAAAVVLVLLPLVQGRDWGWPWWGWLLLVGGLVLLTGFVRYERRLAARGGEPIFDPALLKVRSFTVGLASAVLFFGALAPFFLVLSIYLQVGTGRSAWETGVVILPYAIGSMITSGIGVALVARAGRALLVSGSLLLAGSAVLVWVVVRADATVGYWPLAAALFVGGAGLGLGAPILVNVVLAGVPGRQAGAAGGVLSTVTQLGGAIGLAVLGTIFFDAVELTEIGSDGLAGTYAAALTTVLPWQVATYLLAAVLMLGLPKNAASSQSVPESA